MRMPTQQFVQTLNHTSMSWFNAHYYRHTYEGPDDMLPFKSFILGTSVQIPITRDDSILEHGKASIYVSIELWWFEKVGNYCVGE